MCFMSSQWSGSHEIYFKNMRMLDGNYKAGFESVKLNTFKTISFKIQREAQSSVCLFVRNYSHPLKESG